jgi:hypothetical protein
MNAKLAKKSDLLDQQDVLTLAVARLETEAVYLEATS